MQIAILDDYLDSVPQMAAWDRLPDDMQLTIFNHHLGEEQAVIKALMPFDVVIVMRERTVFPASVLSKLDNLKLLVTTGMRNLSIDMDAARERNVDVCGTRMAGYAAAEHSWALVMALAKQIPLADSTMKTGGWQAAWSEPLNGRTLGVMGLGKLGSQVATYGNAFGMNVIAWSENLTEQRAAECGAKKVAKDELLSQSDFIVIQLVLSERTCGLIGPVELKKMKSSAYLVNTSRGPIVDEAALISALKQRQLKGAGVDVFDVEPLPGNHEFRQLDNIVLTGHTGYMISNGIADAYEDAIEDILAWREGESLRLLN